MKHDPIDMKIAEFINKSQTDHMKMLFLRQSEGEYFFGTRKIRVKLEKNDIKVRVGGGYVSLEEFAEMHTNQELEKVDNKANLEFQGRQRASRDSHGGKSVSGLGTIPESPIIRNARRSATERRSSSRQDVVRPSSVSGDHTVKL